MQHNHAMLHNLMDNLKAIQVQRITISVNCYKNLISKRMMSRIATDGPGITADSPGTATDSPRIATDSPGMSQTS